MFYYQAHKESNNHIGPFFEPSHGIKLEFMMRATFHSGLESSYLYHTFAGPHGENDSTWQPRTSL